MPFFSFILKENYQLSSFGILESNSRVLKKKTKYYSKSTIVWKKLNKKNIYFKIDSLKSEQNIKINTSIKKILFCLPPNLGVGDAIEYGLAIRAIKRKKIFSKIGIAFCSRSHKILKKFVNPNDIYSDFITEDQMNLYEGLFHFTFEIESLKMQKYERKNIEDSVLKFFNIPSYRPKKNIQNKKVSTVSIFPIANSPIRTLSIYLVNDIIHYLLKRNFKIDLIIGNDQLASHKYIEYFNLTNINIIRPKNLDKLNNYIKKIEFGIFCDSGPLHLSKIYQKKGLLISTSVNSKEILNHKDIIESYNSKFKSQYCESPCGLTNIINLNNVHGCYYTLKKKNDDVLKAYNIHLLNRGNLKKSYKNFIDNPVGCVESIKFENIRMLLVKLLG